MSDYAKAGVDIAAGTRATELMSTAVKSTYTPQVLAGIGSFGGLFDAAFLKEMRHPVLVASTDGVGTKTMVAAHAGKWDSIGQDLVNHCINDILVQGARPLFFMDYVASSKLDAEQVAAVVGGIASACREAGCALLGGETAEMPGVYAAGEVDVAGTIVGVVERDQIIDGKHIQPGDVILSLRSSGPHTNGYSLARRVLVDLDWGLPLDELEGKTIQEALLAVHRSYLRPVQTLIENNIDIRGMAHITGGGVIDNLPRIFQPGIGAVIQRGSWSIPPIFTLIQHIGEIDDQEMAHVFNLGLGMLIVLPKEQADAALTLLPVELEATIVGEVVSGEGVLIQ